ncbi:hypothetical protein PBY51_007250 [Eleginops maclovinus]|uniref:Uncharacterized protein n=1 Tax=Eleginops maclovinus TaxID=56733 RepID=A0AAN7X0V5_ELEMC|nr:hypothetical protein PBY51_007250 [Eleginops maclovinus]
MSTSSCISAPSPSSSSGRKRKIGDEVINLRLEQLHEERMRFLQQYREDKEREQEREREKEQERERERQQDTPESCFLMVLADMLTTVDSAYQREARHKLYQQMFAYTVKNPRLD